MKQFLKNLKLPFFRTGKWRIIEYKLKEGLNCYLVQEEHLILSIFSVWVDLDIFTMTHKEALVKYISRVLNTYKIS